MSLRHAAAMLAAIALALPAAMTTGIREASATCQVIDPSWTLVLLPSSRSDAQPSEGNQDALKLLDAANTLKAHGDGNACRQISRALRPPSALADDDSDAGAPAPDLAENPQIQRERAEPDDMLGAMPFDDEGFRPSPAAMAPSAVAPADDGPAKTKAMIGAPVHNIDDISVGKIEDLILSDQGVLGYAIVGYGGFLGLGEKKIAVPFLRITSSADGKRFYIGMSNQQIEMAPQFDATRFSWNRDGAWRAANDRYYAHIFKPGGGAFSDRVASPDR